MNNLSGMATPFQLKINRFSFSEGYFSEKEPMTVHLYIRIRLSDGGRQYVDPVYAANGELKPLYAVVAGNP